MQPSSFLQVVSDLKSLMAVLKGARLSLLLSVPPALRQIKEHEDARNRITPLNIPAYKIRSLLVTV